jgi:hypothetical protein
MVVGAAYIALTPPGMEAHAPERHKKARLAPGEA